MTINVKNIQSAKDFHEVVNHLKTISDASDRQLTSKLQEKKGNLEGRWIILLKKILSILPGVNPSTTNLDEVAKAVAKFAVANQKIGYFTIDDQKKLREVIEKLKLKGQEFHQGNEKVLNTAIETISKLPVRTINKDSFTLEDISALREKAKIFVEGDQSNEIAPYIESVLINPLFQSNPQLFMDNWKKERGGTEEFRIGEDSARMFFNAELPKL